MTYTIRHGIITLMVGIVIGAAIMALAVADVADAQGHDDAAGIAQCIEEFDYTHPGRTMHDNLVRGIRWCNLIDAATAHTCVAPCTVLFGRGMEEDMVHFDYARRTMRVWRGSPDR